MEQAVWVLLRCLITQPDWEDGPTLAEPECDRM